MPKITIDKDKCVGCGLCEQSCPEVFVLTYAGFARLTLVDCVTYDWDKIKETAEQCPVGAIEIK